MKKLFVLAFVAILAMPLFAADGAAIFKDKCTACHGADGAKVFPALGVKQLNTAEVKAMGPAKVAGIITKGQRHMPAFGGKLSAAEINAVATFVLTLKK